MSDELTNSQYGTETRRRLPRWKKILFAALACVGFFAIAELALWLAGIYTLIEREDPFHGFSGLVTVYHRDNAFYRTRPSIAGTTFNDQSFEVRKPKNGLRIFCLGGSSSYGFPWGSQVAFDGIVGKLIAQNHPNLQVEAINASGVSYAMHRLNIVADELFDYEPDIFIVFSGHNEFIEPTFFDAFKQRSAERNKLEYLCAHSRIYSGMRAAFLKNPLQDFDFRADVRRDNARVFSAQQKREVVADFRWRLDRLVRRAKDQGVQVVLVTVPCNLREWGPNASTTVAALDADQQAAWSKAFASGQRHLRANEFQQARDRLEQAASIAPGHADTHFLLAKSYENLELWDKARSAYRQACDADASPTRCISAINDATRAVGKKYGVPIVDAERVFEQEAEHNLVGLEYLEDYVHPTPKGHELIAWHVWGAIEKAGWFGTVIPARREVFDQVIAQRSTPSTAANAMWFYNQGVLLEKQGHAAAAIEKYRQALDISPHYAAVMENLGGLLFSNGQVAESVEVLEQAVKIDPKQFRARSNLGNALLGMGRYEEAVEHCEEALRLNPEFAEAHNSLGNALQKLERFDEAVEHYEQALQLKPDLSIVRSNLGLALLSLGRYDDAVAHCEEALRLAPNSAEAHLKVAMALQGQGRLEEAAGNFEHALRLKGTNDAAHSKLANILERLGKFEGALEHYQKAVELRPDFAPAHNNLAWFLATCPVADYRNGEKAVATATQACELSEWKDFTTLDTLAAAYAERGEFERAVDWQTKAIDLAPAEAKTALRANLQLYQAETPYRASTMTP